MVKKSLTHTCFEPKTTCIILYISLDKLFGYFLMTYFNGFTNVLSYRKAVKNVHKQMHKFSIKYEEVSFA